MLFLFSFILSFTHQHSIIFRDIVSSQISYLVTFGLAFFQLSSKSFQGYIHIPCPSFEMYFECYHFSFLYKPTTTHISVLFFFLLTMINVYSRYEYSYIKNVRRLTEDPWLTNAWKYVALFYVIHVKKGRKEKDVMKRHGEINISYFLKKDTFIFHCVIF